MGEPAASINVMKMDKLGRSKAQERAIVTRLNSHVDAVDKIARETFTGVGNNVNGAE